MKRIYLSLRPLVMTGLSLLMASTLAPVFGQEPQPGAAAAGERGAATGTATASGAVKLPYGVADVLKLSQAQISEDIIVNYVQNSGTIYNLAPGDIVYLRNQGVSDRVLNTMLDQKGRVAGSAAGSGPQVVASAGPAAGMPAPAPAPAPVEAAPPAPAPGPGPAPGTAAVEAPMTPPASSVYVIPYPAATSAYYGSYYYPYGYGYPYAYSYPYPYYWGPRVSVGVRIGGGYWGGGGHWGGGHWGGGHWGHRGR
jgi:hypothetical protein